MAEPTRAAGSKTGPGNGVRIGVDVGGTFTDLVSLDEATGEVRIAKVPSTPDNQAYGVLSALEAGETALEEISLIVHGTTTTTNAVLERTFSRTGLVTTRGFRDVLELGRRTRPAPYGMKGRFVPVIPRDLRLEVTERIDAAGDVVIPLDDDSVRAAAGQLRAAGCEAVVVHFIHSYANPVHEERAAGILRETWPGDHVTMGHALLSESREFERGVTAAVNASVQPLLERYIRRLISELEQRGYSGELLVMNGNGGMVPLDLVSREAAKTVMSGPASGVVAAARTGTQAGVRHLISYDMGGTSTDVALIRDAEPAVSSETEVEYGLPIHVPMVDVRSVGAGGGSIARVNAAGLLEVGPESAGAVPGPICYGRGGTRPTISDANLLLGRLDAERLTSVSGGVAPGRVATVFEDEIGRPLGGLDATSAAAAVIRLANTRMAGAIRMVSVSLGADPRDFVLFAFGGAGPLHACALARELAVPEVMVPALPGMTNALGCIMADLRHDFVNTLNRPLDQVDEAELHAVFADQVRRGDALLDRSRVAMSRRDRVFSVEMQFVGQSHLLRVPLDTPTPDRALLRRRFEEVYWERFRIELPEIGARLVAVATSVIGVRGEPDLSCLIDPGTRSARLEDARTGTRPVYFDAPGARWITTPVYRRTLLPGSFSLEGPALIEQLDTTILVEPGDTARGGEDGNIRIRIGEAGP